MHMPEHVAAQILLFATTLFTDTNMFEAGHKPNIKDPDDSDGATVTCVRAPPGMCLIACV